MMDDERATDLGPGIPPDSAVPMNMKVMPLRTFHTDPHADPAVEPTYFSNVNVPFSHPSEDKA